MDMCKDYKREEGDVSVHTYVSNPGPRRTQGSTPARGSCGVRMCGVRPCSTYYCSRDYTYTI
jgi:hypothetical protein